MGLYINPSNEDKAAWLHRNAVLVLIDTIPPAHRVDDMLCVCLVDNGGFTAAAVAYSERELRAFTDPNDDRRKAFFYCRITDLAEVCGMLVDELEAMDK